MAPSAQLKSSLVMGISVITSAISVVSDSSSLLFVDTTSKVDPVVKTIFAVQ